MPGWVNVQKRSLLMLSLMSAGGVLRMCLECALHDLMYLLAAEAVRYVMSSAGSRK